MVFIIILMALMVIDIETITAGVSKGITICMANVAPSLLVFMIMSDVILNLNKKTRIKPKWIAFFLGSICGFPVGAHICDNLYMSGRISKKENQVLTAACNNVSPAFVIGAIGNSMLGDKKLGILLYFAEIIAAVVFVLPINNVLNYSTGIENEQSITKIFTDSIEKSVWSILKISVIICFFSGMLELILKYTNDSVYLILSSILEISNGAIASSALFGTSPTLSVAILAFACGFGGLCVHMQIITAHKSIKVKYFPLFFQKLLQGMLTSLLSVIGYKVINMLEI